ncbi:23S rRNA (uracil(1939)-C(5))-methyltransferase RlmD [Litorilituus lipolyticus]|uniref:23S rRNA (uracil(1939)-C(5))-methyltransferase RlmD n=1 Tax=Litorilituus lipolyticus TaxID=2491017 RepID=A0A502L3E7_9GAMM|nr:23S rRNA (uracil(1939)-C(5))-methyltransferase RlmD [Litorilituus lipolyticus]TPH16573.1 23S rRNA (uracil(1939)-C(5))-methyltransferase RlmD [Litorilituus lipolyticus]
MANFFKASKKNKAAGQILTLTIERLDLNGCGVARYNKKPLFVAEALAGELVEVRLIEQKNKFAKAKLLKVITPSPARKQVKCQHFSVCGGCDIQPLSYEQQLSFKQAKVAELFARQDFKETLPWQPTIKGSPWHYRRKARIGVQFNKHGQPIVGFREKASSHLTAIKNCPVLVEPLAPIFVELKSLIEKLSVKQAIGHVDVIWAAVSQCGIPQGIVNIRQLKVMNEHDVALWQQFGDKFNYALFVDNGIQTVAIDEYLTASSEPSDNMPFSYPLANKVNIAFGIKDFIQINHEVNTQMIAQAIDWLELKQSDNVLDLFCGLGNFSLAIAKHVANVVGVEGVQSMVDKALKNAKRNGIENCQFYQANINESWQAQPWFNEYTNTNEHQFNKVLLDPARAGAEEAMPYIAMVKPSSILYVSCDPATLARDSEILVGHGYKLNKISIIDMFSQTKHVESMVLFTRA